MRFRVSWPVTYLGASWCYVIALQGREEIARRCVREPTRAKIQEAKNEMRRAAGQ